MPDISLCLAHNCSLKDKCNRYTDQPLGYYQSYIAPKSKETGKNCKVFMKKPKK